MQRGCSCTEERLISGDTSSGAESLRKHEVLAALLDIECWTNTCARRKPCGSKRGNQRTGVARIRGILQAFAGDAAHV